MNRPSQTTQSNWFLKNPNPPSEGPMLRLFCFSFAGGGASVYNQWKKVFPQSVEICPVQLPGRENRLSEPPCAEMPLLIGNLYDEIAPLLNKPFVFFGHSMGAQVAYELAGTIRKHLSMEPAHFFASACHAPHLMSPPPMISSLPDEAFLQHIQCYGGTPKAVFENEALMKLILPTLRADFLLTENYRTQLTIPFMFPITAFCGSEDFRYHEDLIRPWRDHTNGTFQFHIIEGDHFFIRSAHKYLTERVMSPIMDLI